MLTLLLVKTYIWPDNLMMSHALALMVFVSTASVASGTTCHLSSGVSFTERNDGLDELIKDGEGNLSRLKFQEAEHSFRRALKFALQLPDIDSTVINLLNCLGVSLHCQGKDSEAITCFQQALGKIPGGSSSPDIRRGKVLSNLALAYSVAGRRQEAMRCCDEALEIFRKQGVSPLTESRLLNTIGRMLMDEHCFLKAEEMFANALALREKAVGNESTELVSPLVNLSSVLLAQGKFAECEQVCKRAIMICERKLGSDEGKLFPILNNLSHANAEQSKYKEAQQNLERAILIAEKTFGKTSLEVMVAYANLCELYEADGEQELAEKALIHALEVSKIKFGPGDSKTADMTEALADLYESHGNFSEAERLRFFCRVLRKSQ